MLINWRDWAAPRLCFADPGTGGDGAGDPGAGSPPPRTALTGGDGGSGGGDGAPPANPWPETWRETLAGDDQKALARLQRMTTPADLFKSYREIETKLSSRGTVPALPENPAPEEVAAYRKAMGIPEAPDGYGLAFPETFTASDTDKETLTTFQAQMHAAHVPPAAAKAAFDFYVKSMGEQAQARNEAAEQATLESLGELRGEFKGREYERQMRIADEFLMKHFGDDDATLGALNAVLTMRLPNGVPVMYSAPFMKGLFKMAAASADDEALIGGDVAGAGKSIDEEYNELIKIDGRRLTPQQNARLQELAGAKVRREERAGRQAI